MILATVYGKKIRVANNTFQEIVEKGWCEDAVLTHFHCYSEPFNGYCTLGVVIHVLNDADDYGANNYGRKYLPQSCICLSLQLMLDL